MVAGAGSIGCFVGGLLAANGHPVTLLVRPRVADQITAHGLTLTDLDGMETHVTPDHLHLAQDPSCLAQADIVLVTVKSRDTQSIAEGVARYVAKDSHIVSLQNGISSATLLRDALPDYDVRAGMVPFNVVPSGDSGYHRATDGNIVIEAGQGGLGHLLSVPDLPIDESSDIENVQWGKFLLNLNNALNALSGQPLRVQLTDHDWRKVMADQWDEALHVITAAGVTPVSSTPVPVKVIPWILRLPTFLFTRAASAMLKIDPQARTSMAYDLIENRPTEIDALQGEIMRMGQRLGIATPINSAVAQAVKRAEADGAGSPTLSAAQLRDHIAQP